MLKGSLLELAIGRGKRRSALGVAVPQMPDDTATDYGGQIDPLAEAVAVFLIGQDIRWQRQTTLDQHGHQAVVPQGTDQTIEGHRGDMADGGDHSKLRPPWVAVKAWRATPGLMRR